MFQFISDLFGVIFNLIFEGVVLITEVGALGISIIVFTLVAQLLMTPIKMKQQRSIRAMTRLNPELQKLQKKYANKKDQASQMAYSQEMQALYKKHNANPLSGCLPLLIQLPLIYGVYGVLREPVRYINKLGDLYSQIATSLQQTGSTQELVQKVIEQVPFSATATAELSNLGDQVQLVDTLSRFTTQQWEALKTFISTDQINAIAELLEQKTNYELFFVNLVDSPQQLVAGGVLLALAIPVIAAASTFIFTKVTMAASRASQPTSGDAPQQAESMMKVMNIMMPIMMGAFSWTVSTGLALYWVAGNVIMMFQQIIINRIVDKKEAELDAKLKAEKEAELAAAKAKKKKKKKKKPPVEGEQSTLEMKNATEKDGVEESKSDNQSEESNDTKQD